VGEEEEWRGGSTSIIFWLTVPVLSPPSFPFFLSLLPPPSSSFLSHLSHLLLSFSLYSSSFFQGFDRYQIDLGEKEYESGIFVSSRCRGRIIITITAYCQGAWRGAERGSATR